MRTLLVMMLAVTAAHAAPDPHSYANADAIVVEHAHIDLSVSFERQQLSGFVELRLRRIDPQVNTLILDTRDLSIQSVLAVDGEQFLNVPFKLAKRDPIFGQALSINLPAESTRVRIAYHTAPQASGLQWLAPELTAGKTKPFLFSQSQAIHARSWVPIQDTPMVRFRYSARINTPKGLLARMSADNNPLDAADGDYRFTMQQPIPSYLLAIAVGELKFAPLGDRSGVYAEPSVLDKAAYEFADTERMIEITESLYGPYRWGRYDLLVLPASFPFGGMENPRLTFLTPTVIAGDRSLVALIAHELAHSWSGNLVTNTTWDHFWLNEGFTTYVENRIVEAAFGVERADTERELAERELDVELADLPPAEQHLRLNLPGRDPDDGLTGVAYTKGMTLLRFLEQRFGREVFDPFVRAWYDGHAFGTVNTDDFLTFLQGHLLDKHPNKVSAAEIAQFIDGPGYPDIAPRTKSQRFIAIDQLRKDWLAGGVKLDSIDTSKFSTQEWIRLIEGLPASVTPAQLAQLDEQFELSSAGNSEIAFAWYSQAIRRDYQPAFEPMADFLQRIGRRKFVLPLFTALMENAAHHRYARETYAKARPGYHPITRSSVDEVLK